MSKVIVNGGHNTLMVLKGIESAFARLVDSNAWSARISPIAISISIGRSHGVHKLRLMVLVTQITPQLSVLYGLLAGPASD